MTFSKSFFPDEDNRCFVTNAPRRLPKAALLGMRNVVSGAFLRKSAKDVEKTAARKDERCRCGRATSRAFAGGVTGLDTK